MKKLLLLVATLILVFGATSVHAQENLPEHFTWSEQGFSISLPPNWVTGREHAYFNQYNFAQKETDLTDSWTPSEGYTIQVYVYVDSQPSAEDYLNGIVDLSNNFSVDGDVENLSLDNGYDIAMVRGDLNGVSTVGMAIIGGSRRMFYLWGFAPPRWNIDDLADLMRSMVDTVVIGETIYGVPHDRNVPYRGDITVDDFTHGELTDNALQVSYTFEPNAGDVISVRLESPDFDTYIWVLDENGNEIVYNDDYFTGDFTFSLINGFVAPRNATYTLIIGSYEGDSTGSFTIEMSEGIAEPRGSVVGEDGNGFINTIEDEIAYGDSVDDTLLNLVDFVGYTFEGGANDNITIRVRSDEFAPSIVLVNADNEMLVVSQSNEDRVAIEEFVLPEDGVYTVYVGGVDRRPHGDFNLKLRIN